MKDGYFCVTIIQTKNHTSYCRGEVRKILILRELKKAVGAEN